MFSPLRAEVLVVLGIMSFAATVASFAVMAYFGVGPRQPLPSYPGRHGIARGWTDLASRYMQEDAQRYYIEHGRFPRTWGELNADMPDCRQLTGWRNQPIDPDDGVIDSLGDVTYSCSADGRKAWLMLGGNLRTAPRRLDIFVPPVTRAELEKRKRELDPGKMERPRSMEDAAGLLGL